MNPETLAALAAIAHRRFPSSKSWHRSNDSRPWGVHVERQTAQNATIYKHPEFDEFYMSAREALFHGRLSLPQQAASVAEHLDHLLEVLTGIHAGLSPVALATKAFGGSRVLCDHYLVWLDLLSLTGEDKAGLRLTSEAQAMVRMLRQPSTAATSGETPASSLKTDSELPKRRRVMMG
jgi:hypothetical protein